MPRCEAAADGVSADVIDLRTLMPWDRDMVLDSVARTRRCLIVQEDLRTGMNLGADDYLVKPVVPDDLIASVRARLWRAGQAAAAAPKRAAGAESTPALLAALGLTPREAEVLFWVARGKTNDEIGTVLGIGLTTVKKHLESTYAKLGVENRTTAAAMALERLAAG